MSAGARLAGYAVVVGLAVGGGALVGAAIGPDPESDTPAPAHGGHDATSTTIAERGAVHSGNED